MAKLINFSDLVNKDGVTKRVGELLFATAYETNDLGLVCEIITNQKNGGKVSFLKPFSAVGTAGGGCNPTWKSVTPDTENKTWAMGQYEIPLSVCADDWASLLREYNLLDGNTSVDLRDRRIISEILLPMLDAAKRRALWRIVWEADTAADTFANGGHLTNGTDTSLFTMTDGLWKKLTAIGSQNANQLTAIAANAATGYNNQEAAIYAPGIATGIMDDIIRRANGRIRGAGGEAFMTKRFFDALQADYEAKYNQTMPYETVSEGVQISRYRGVRIVIMPEIDAIIDEFENDGTSWHQPYRVVYTPRVNMKAGTEDRKVDAEVELGYNSESRLNTMYSASLIGTVIGEDDMVHVAF